MGLRIGPEAGGPLPLLVLAQSGDHSARDQLIGQFMPFILKAASRAAGRYLQPGADEEISVALLAFNEAIDSYNGAKGSFLGFAQTVIKRRLIDYFRRQAPAHREIPLSELETEDQPSHPLHAQVDLMAHIRWRDKQSDEARIQEISEFRELLNSFAIRFEDLPKISPRHQDARERALQISRLIASTPHYREHLWDKKALPLKDLCREPGISRKVVERHRKYIIAVAVILLSDLPYLQTYVRERLSNE